MSKPTAEMNPLCSCPSRLPAPRNFHVTHRAAISRCPAGELPYASRRHAASAESGADGEDKIRKRRRYFSVTPVRGSSRRRACRLEALREFTALAADIASRCVTWKFAAPATCSGRNKADSSQRWFGHVLAAPSRRNRALARRTGSKATNPFPQHDLRRAFLPADYLPSEKCGLSSTRTGRRRNQDALDAVQRIEDRFVPCHKKRRVLMDVSRLRMTARRHRHRGCDPKTFIAGCPIPRQHPGPPARRSSSLAQGKNVPEFPSWTAHLHCRLSRWVRITVPFATSQPLQRTRPSLAKK